jgi:glycosyltransferase involved in cell wall biosynthesis
MPYSKYAGGFATAVKRIATVARKVTLSAETEAAAELWSGKTGFRFDICRCIVDFKELPIAQELPIQTPVVVAWLGEVRAEKGADIVPAIIERVLVRAKPGEVKFLVQGSGRTSRKARKFDALLAKFGHSIERLPDGLAPSDYKAALGRSNIILLPYNPTCYPPTRGSGIAVESLITAKPIVATRGTFAETLIICGNGVIGSDVEELASGILQILSSYEDFHAGSLRAREKALVDYDLLSTYRQMSVPREIHQVG